jgi:hypothetical protein
MSGRAGGCRDRVNPLMQRNTQRKDAVCLAELIDLADGDFKSSFRQFKAARLLRTAHPAGVTLDREFYHVEGIARDVRNETCRGWSEHDVFRCLAWIYGIELPSKMSHANGAARARVPAGF